MCNIELSGNCDPDIKHLLSHGWESLYENRRENLRVRSLFGERAEFQQVFEDILPPSDVRREDLIVS